MEARVCSSCGRPFQPRSARHRLCDSCYWRRRRLRQVHPAMGWLDQPLLVLGVMVVGVALAIVARGCGR